MSQKNEWTGRKAEKVDWFIHKGRSFVQSRFLAIAANDDSPMDRHAGVLSC